MSKIFVKQTEITIIVQGETDYISLTDMVKNMPNNYSVIGHWLRLKDTIEYIGLWEKLNNPNFKLTEFGEFIQNAGSNRFTLSPQQWINKTNAIGIISKSGKYGGTYAHKDIAFHFAMWLSPEFHLLIVKEFQRLKEQEQKLLNPEWDYRRFLSKVNYRLQTDSIKENIIPHYNNLSKEQETYIYANEAEMLNVAVFGITSKQWRENNSKATMEGYNIRDYADVLQLTVIANLETLNSHLIKQQISPKERLEKLKAEATSQLKSLMNCKYTYPLESPRKYEQNKIFGKKIK
ncbi:MAG: KilA-N domain-containing protein [Bacteroidales bacterium]|jgi:hypothetical protein